MFIDMFRYNKGLKSLEFYWSEDKSHAEILIKGDNLQEDERVQTF